MTSQNYGKCLDHVFKFEGGYVDHPRDPGGATNMGITIGTLSAHLGRPATKQEVRDLSRDTAAMIYKRKYWNVVRGDDLPDGMDLVAFDGGVNSGPSRGARWLQRGLGVTADGKIGPQTIGKAVSVTDGVKAIQRACAVRLGFLKGLGTWSTFGRGWGRRVAAVEAEAVAMYTRDAGRVAAEAPRAEGAAKQRTGEAAGVGAGGGATSFADVPDLLFYGVLAAALVVAVLLVTRAAQHKRRAAAYRAKAEEMANG